MYFFYSQILCGRLYNGSLSIVGVKENALAFHAFRKICSAVKKAALFEQSITITLSNHHTIMNTTKATSDHYKCEFAAFRLSKFFSPFATGVWGHCAPRGFAYFCPLKVGRRKAKPCTTSPAGERISLFAENYPQHILEYLYNFVIARSGLISREYFSNGPGSVKVRSKQDNCYLRH